jgi:aryl-alcohol dehydrogenase-like predicted oxidoreductase
MAIPYFRVPLNLKHAATISKRIVYHVQRLNPQSGQKLDKALLLATALLDCLRPYVFADDNPPLSEAKPVIAEAAAQAREFVAEIERLKAGDDRLGQAVRNLFECLELGEEGAEISLRAGENPDSALRATEIPRTPPKNETASGAARTLSSGPKLALAKRQLGRTEMWVTPVGLGGAWLGKCADGFSDEQAIATVLRALDAGINLIDTSPLYGESERRVGLALEAWAKRGGKRSDVVLTTKTGTRTRPHDYSGASTRRSVEESLRLLKTDYLDVVLVHDPDDIAPALEKGGAFDELAKMKTEKLIRAIGLGVRDHEFHRRCIEAGVVDMCLTYRDFNLVNQSGLRGVIEPAASRGVGVVNATVVMAGLLGGNDPLLAAPRPEQLGAYYAQKAEVNLACKLWEFAKAHGVSLLALNLQWILRESRVASTLLGVANAEELNADISALQAPITEAVWADLRDQFGL